DLLIYTIPHPPRPTLFPYTTLFRSDCLAKDPDSRPAADEALMRLLGHVPAAPRHPLPPQTAGQPASQASPPQNPPPHGSLSQSRSEEHTSELQSRENLVCRLLLEKK